MKKVVIDLGDNCRMNKETISGVASGMKEVILGNIAILKKEEIEVVTRKSEELLDLAKIWICQTHATCTTQKSGYLTNELAKIFDASIEKSSLQALLSIQYPEIDSLLTHAKDTGEGRGPTALIFLVLTTLTVLPTTMPSHIMNAASELAFTAYDAEFSKEAEGSTYAMHAVTVVSEVINKIFE